MGVVFKCIIILRNITTSQKDKKIAIVLHYQVKVWVIILEVNLWVVKSKDLVVTLLLNIIFKPIDGFSYFWLCVFVNYIGLALLYKWAMLLCVELAIVVHEGLKWVNWLWLLMRVPSGYKFNLLGIDMHDCQFDLCIS